MSRPDALADRIQDYLPPQEILSIPPSPLDLQRRDTYRKYRPNGDFSLTLYQDKLRIVPSWHPLNTTSIANNSSVYGTGSMETLTLEPVVDRNDQASIVLLPPRLTRLYSKALPAREINPPVDEETFSQGIVDLMAVLGTDILKNNDMGSIRVTVGPGAGKFGKSAVGQPVNLSVESYGTSRSLPNKPLAITAGPNQRLSPFLGKHSSHYGEAGRIGQVAARMGGDDAIFFAPFEASDPSQTHYLTPGSSNLKDQMMRLALANGLGAEVMAINKDGTLLLPPLGVNRLGGVTSQYIKDHLAPDLSVETEEKLFSLQEIESGEITALMLVGNAARVSLVGEIIMHDDTKRFSSLKLPKPTTSKAISAVFEAQSKSIVRPSHYSLLTPVDINDGAKAMAILEDKFADWFN